jgi:uncharacterized protein YbjQ (UPF0145 family)
MVERERALEQLRPKAHCLGANAVMSMRLTANQISSDMTGVVDYGAAVVVEPPAPPDGAASSEPSES